MIAALDLVQRDFLVQTDPRLDPLVSNPVSAHELGPYGLVQHLNFLVTGLLIGVFGEGLYRALPPSRWAKASRVALIVLGFGIALGVFTLDVANTQTWHGRIHGVGFLASKVHLLITFGFLEVIAIWLWTSAVRSEASART